MNIDQAELARILARDHLVSVCAGCGAITRVQKGVHHGLSHGVCPDCMERLYPEYAPRVVA
jgi:NADH pyrophosphatase NudC (nudix superfamily)